MAVNACMRTLQRLWIDDKFENFFKLKKQLIYVKNQFCQELDNHQGVVLHSMFFLLLRNTTKESTLKQLTLLMGSLREGSCKSFSFVRQIKEVLLDNANAKCASLPEKVKSTYHQDIDMDTLKIQLKMLPNTVKIITMYGIPIKQVT